MKKNNILIERKAKYIINLVKSVGKSIDYALSIVCWYTMTESEENEIKKIIIENFN